MERLEEGVFLLEAVEMPCAPSDIKLDGWVIPGYPGDAGYPGDEGQQEAVARIISFSQKRGVWVGVTWERLVEMIRDEAGYSCCVGKLRTAVRVMLIMHRPALASQSLLRLVEDDGKDVLLPTPRLISRILVAQAK